MGAGRWPLSGMLLLVYSLPLITSQITPTVFGSPASQGARSSAPPPCLANRTDHISPCRGGGSRGDAPLNSSWVNLDVPGGGGYSFKYDGGAIVRPLLVQGISGPSFACGFFCRDFCNFFLFSIFLVVTNGSSAINDSSGGFPQVVWSANRKKLVGEGARLELTPDGELVLSDSGGTRVWSTNTVGKNVSGMKLTEMGNLVLYNSTGETVWQSFDHATDTVLPGQSVDGQKLIANASATASAEGMFYLNVAKNSLYAFFHNDTPEMYFSNVSGSEDDGTSSRKPRDNGVLWVGLMGLAFNLKPTIPAHQFIRMEQDGHLRLYKWRSAEEPVWSADVDLLTQASGQCIYPDVCGAYGICSPGQQLQQCRCPEPDYFQPLDSNMFSKGCAPSVPLSCRSQDAHFLVPQPNISYFGYVQPADLLRTDVESCKDACHKKCSCIAAFFKYGVDSSRGDCYLPSYIHSLMVTPNGTAYNSAAFIKVQSAPLGGSASRHSAGKRSRVLGTTLGALFALLLLGIVATIALRRRKENDDELEGWLPHLPGMPTRFSYEEMKSATGNFSRLLGEGGFGSVFLGTLHDGMSVAVKLLGGKGQMMKQFLAEVETIGSIHHVNLVRLVGYCAHKLHRLLVYEYMCNGSLDKWIFHRDDNPRTLDWQARHRIILHVAKGLAYLHEDCRHRIAHLDIKPENILLDDGFNAKISDFGLSKLIDRNQSQVLTTMRGTPGYLAPEWLNSMITEKVDVYSFGVVMLETVCGRRNIDSFRPQQKVTLVNEVKSAAEKDRLLDIVDRNCC